MIITKTPIRITFLGGGSDYPEYYKKYIGQTLGLAINKYSTISISDLPVFSDCAIELSYRNIERVKNLHELTHPSVRECLKFMGIKGGIQIHYTGDLPARTGLGSSSSFTVGLLHALHKLKGENVDHMQLADEAIYVEQNLIKERVGCQDQYTCAYGGLLHLQYGLGDKIEVMQSPIDRETIEKLLENFVLLYTGIQRYADDVLEEQSINTKSGIIDSHISAVAEMVPKGISALKNKDFDSFGLLLDQAWELKKKFSSAITNPIIDDIYNVAKKCGSLGGKLLGAGGGGFFLIYINPKLREKLLNELSQYHVVDIKGDFNGSHIYQI